MNICKYKLLISMSILTFLSTELSAVTKGEKKFIEEQVTPSIQLDVIAMRDKNLISKNDLEDLGNIKPSKQPDALVDLISDAIANGEIIKAPPPKPKVVEAPVKKVISSKEPERVVRRYIVSDEPEPQKIIIERADPATDIISEIARTAQLLIKENADEKRDKRRYERWKEYDRRGDKTIIIKEPIKEEVLEHKKKDMKLEKDLKSGKEKDVKKTEESAKEKVILKDEKKLPEEKVEKKDLPKNQIEELPKKADDKTPEKLDKDEPKAILADEKPAVATTDTTADGTKKIADEPLGKEKIDEAVEVVKDSGTKTVETVEKVVKKPDEPLVPKNLRSGG